MLTPYASPDIVSSCVRQYSAAWTAERTPCVSWEDMGVQLPEALKKAVRKRQTEFIAGRLCAAQALGAAGCGDPDRILASVDRAPVWPKGYAGSITHTEGFVSAAVAREADLRSIGIDTERIMSDRTAGDVGELVAGGEPFEKWAAGCAGNLGQAEWTTLMFSAKESVYKCVHPLAKTFLGFSDVALVACDWAAAWLVFRLTKAASPEFSAGFELTCRWMIKRPYVHAAVELPWDYSRMAPAHPTARQ